MVSTKNWAVDGPDLRLRVTGPSAPVQVIVKALPAAMPVSSAALLVI